MRPSEVLPPSVLALDERYPYEVGHRRQVARLALRLFDELQSKHDFGENERLLLHCAGQLHDIGVTVDAAKHHKAAQRMILEAELPPFSETEQAIIALVARYHRKALPSLKHAIYAELSEDDQQVVRWLAALLRVADGLDRTHANAVRDVRCYLTQEDIRIAILADGPTEVERAVALEKGKLLEDVLGKRVGWGDARVSPTLLINRLFAAGALCLAHPLNDRLSAD